MWEWACPANTGEARAIHRVGFFAGKPAPTGPPAGLRLMQYLGKQLACSISRI
ncbi:diguanylate cyclase [Pseudomonas sp. BN607]|nr:diguanylate cyclase [Pseudomonas sp. BN607]